MTKRDAGTAFPWFGAPFKIPELKLPVAGDALAFGRDGFDAAMAAEAAFAEGLESFGRAVLESGQSAVRRNAAALRSLFDVKSFDEALEVQTGLVRAAAEAAAEDGAKLASLAAKIAGEVAAPISAWTAATATKAAARG